MIQIPKIFGVVPTYNHDKWLLECLNGLAGQTHQLSATAIVNDGSTDDTWKLLMDTCKNLASIAVKGDEPAELLTGVYKHMPVLLTRFSKNYGPSISRNYAIRSFLQGNENSILAFCDSDDIYEPTKIAESLPYFIENQHVGVVYSDYTTFNEKGNQKQYKEPYSKLRLMQGEAICNMDSLFKMEVFTKCGMFDESLRTVEDMDRYLDISNKYLFAHIPKSLVRIRVGLHSSSSVVGKQIWEQNYRKVMQKNRK